MTGKKLRVLALTQANRMPNWDLFYSELGKHVTLDYRKLDKREQSNLKVYFKSIDITKYDRIFLELRFKKQLKQRHFIATLPNLVEYEWDATQNYKKGGKYEGAWSKYYSTMSSLRVISSGHIVSERLRNEGHDVRFVPKGFNESEISCKDLPRDISLGFIGRVTKAAYDERKRFLDGCVSELGLQMLRTEPGLAYCEMLNRIRYFVSADHGLDEYMGKNFEAMAAGCILCSYRQGGGEEEALGLVDMANVVLYSDLAELKSKLSVLNSEPSKADEIARAGRLLAEREYTLARLAEKTALELIEPVVSRRELTRLQKLFAWFGR